MLSSKIKELSYREIIKDLDVEYKKISSLGVIARYKFLDDGIDNLLGEIDKRKKELSNLIYEEANGNDTDVPSWAQENFKEKVNTIVANSLKGQNTQLPCRVQN